MRHYFCISDIHGRKLTLEMFEMAGFDITNPDHIIVSLGDYFDRGTQNRNVLQFFMRLKAKLNERCILIYGNHDQYLMDFIKVIEASCEPGKRINIKWPQFERWMFNGGFTTLQELFGSLNGIYTEKKQKNIKRLKEFVSTLIPYYETQQYIFTHACINELREIDTWDRDFLYTGFDTPKTVLIGHTPHMFLDDSVEFVTERASAVSFTYAKSKGKTACPVYNIDNGLGNNIVVMREIIEETQ